MTTPIPGLPPGLALSAAGVISGTPTTAGVYGFSVVATDANGDQSAPQPLTITVVPAVTVTVTGLPGAVVGQPYTFTLTASGGTAPFSWSSPA